MEELHVEESHVEKSPADGTESASAVLDNQVSTGEAGNQASPLTTAVEAVMPAPGRARRCGRAVFVVVSVVLLAASLSGSLYMGGGSIEGFLRAFTAYGPTARAIELPVTPTATFPAATATAMTTATPKPKLVGDGVPPSGGGSYPPYTGPISGGQGCPSGQAPKPAGSAIHGASDYGAPHANVVALTFDDGPTPYYSPAIISYLEQTHTPATFFVLGQYAQAYPWLIQREAADGFTIGIHTWDHPNMVALTPSQRAWQLAATAQQLHADLGANACLWLWRPPYGSYNGAIVAQAATFGLTTIMWNDDPADWSQPGTTTIVNRVLSNARPGSIILLHDGPAGRAQTLAALPGILAGLRQRGLTPVSMPQLLLGYQAPTPMPSPTGVATPTVAPTPTDTPSPTATVVPTPTDTPLPIPGPA